MKVCEVTSPQARNPSLVPTDKLLPSKQVIHIQGCIGNGPWPALTSKKAWPAIVCGGPLAQTTAVAGIIYQNGFCVLLLEPDSPSSSAPRGRSPVDACVSASCSLLCAPGSDLSPSCKVNSGKKPG